MDDKTISTRPRPPLFQFTLRGLAIIVTLAAVTAFWFNSTRSSTQHTNRELDVAVFGRGYLQVSDIESGRTCYTRLGRLSINSEGLLAVGRASDGWQLTPPIIVPEDWTSIHVNKNGGVAITDAASIGQVQIGSIQLARFVNEDGLTEVVPNIYAESKASGAPMVGDPGSGGMGFIQQGWLQRSGTFPAVTPVVIAGVCLVVILFLLAEIRRLHRRLDDVIARMPDRR